VNRVTLVKFRGFVDWNGKVVNFGLQCCFESQLSFSIENIKAHRRSKSSNFEYDRRNYYGNWKCKRPFERKLKFFVFNLCVWCKVNFCFTCFFLLPVKFFWMPSGFHNKSEEVFFLWIRWWIPKRSVVRTRELPSTEDSRLTFWVHALHGLMQHNPITKHKMNIVLFDTRSVGDFFFAFLKPFMGISSLLYR